MRELFDAFDAMTELNSIFGRPTRFVFNTDGTKDMMPACWKVWEEEKTVNNLTDPINSVDKEVVKRGYKATCRTVGINEEDIKITVKDYGICVEGKSEIDGSEYSQYIELPVSRTVMDNIKNIKYKSINGLTFVYLEVSEPEKRKINIQKF